MSHTAETFTEKELTISCLEFEGPNLKPAREAVERSAGQSAIALSNYWMIVGRLNYLLGELWDVMTPDEREAANVAARG